MANPQAENCCSWLSMDITAQDCTAAAGCTMYNLFLTVLHGERWEFTLPGGESLVIAPLRREQQRWGCRHCGMLRSASVGECAATLATFHELRMPTTAIRFVEALLDGLAEDKESQERYLQVILDETIRLNRLITDLLDLSRLETGQLSWPLEPIELRPLLQEVSTKLQPQFARQELQLLLQIPERLPMVFGNRDRLQQVLINLLSNALSFTPAGGRVTLAAAAEHDWVRVSVEDTGIGIPADEQELVWERFHKVDKARTRKLGGTGLGLSIVKQIVEAHGGSVGLESTPGRPFHFFTLPVARDLASAQQ